jgi:glycosyltransferase involved in cell wall biosynthesis
MNPRISVITATRNAMQHLPVLANQLLRYPPELVEWVVVDALSDDGTIAFLESVEDPKLSWKSEPDAGIYDAWNKGISRARGQWLMFVGADDLLGEGWLEACAAAPDADLLYGDLEIRDARGELLTKVKAGPWELVRRHFKTRMVLPHPGLAHNSTLFGRRRFDASFKIAGDFHFLSGADIRSAIRLPLIQATMRLGGVSNRPDQVELAFRENLRAIQQQGLSMPLSDQVRWLIKRSFSAIAPRLFFVVQDMSWRLRQRL